MWTYLAVAVAVVVLVNLMVVVLLARAGPFERDES